MNRITLFMLAIIIISLPLTSAARSEIKIKTVPFHEVQVTAYEANPGAFSAIDSFKAEADEYGDVNFTLDTSETTFNVIVYVKWNYETVISEKYENSYKTGEKVYIELAPVGFKFKETPLADSNGQNITNETLEAAPIEEEVAQTEASEAEFEANSDATLTGLSIDTTVIGKKLKTTGYFVAAGVIVAGIIMFILSRRKKSKTDFGMTEYLSKKKVYSPNHDSPSYGSVNATQIREIEKKIYSAQQELNKLKAQDRIKEAEKKLQADKEYIERLKRGEV